VAAYQQAAACQRNQPNIVASGEESGVKISIISSNGGRRKQWRENIGIEA